MIRPPRRQARAFWREVFEHWIETGLTLPDFCAEVMLTRSEPAYDPRRTYGAFNALWYREFQLHQIKLRVKCGRAPKARVA